MSEKKGARTHLWGLLAIVAAVPFGIGVESLLRALIFPPELETLRSAWGPAVTPWVWGMVPLAVLADVGAWLMLGLWQRRVAETVARDPVKAGWKRFEGLMIWASVAQIPGVLAALCFLFGAELHAVLAVVGVSTLGVFVLARV